MTSRTWFMTFMTFVAYTSKLLEKVKIGSYSISKHESFCTSLRNHVVPTHSDWTPDCRAPFTNTHVLSLLTSRHFPLRTCLKSSWVRFDFTTGMVYQIATKWSSLIVICHQKSVLFSRFKKWLRTRPFPLYLSSFLTGDMFEECVSSFWFYYRNGTPNG